MLHGFVYFCYNMCFFETNLANISCLGFLFTILPYHCVMLWDEYGFTALEFQSFIPI